MRECVDARTGADRRVADHAVRPDSHVVGQRDAAFEYAVHVDRDVAATFECAAHVEASRIGERHTGHQQRLGDIVLMNPFELGKLLLAIHAERFPRFVRLGGDDFEPGFDRHLDRVGQVELALCIVVFQRGEPAAEAPGRRDDDARVDLGDLELLGRCVFLFDDARHLAVLIAHDAAIAAGVVECDGENAVAVPARAIGQRLQRAGARERHIAVQHQRGFGRIEQRQRLLYRVAGAELLLLRGELDVRRSYRLTHGFGAMTDHHDQTLGFKRASRVDDMSEERPAG